MRGLALLLALPFFLFVAFKKPFIALALWVWAALVPPHIWSFGGLATSVRWNMLFALVTIFGFVISKEKKNPSCTLFVLGCLFFIHTTITTIVNYGDGPYNWLRWDWFMRVFLLFVFLCFMLKKKIHFEAIAWAVVLSFSFKAFIEGAKVLSSGGGHNIFGITPGFNDNNLSALAALMGIGFILFLIDQYKDNIRLKYPLLALLFFNVLFVLGSDSRGGFVGLVILGAFYFMKTKHKFKVGLVQLIIGIVGIGLMSADWTERMDTISEAGDDGSFMGRVMSWKLAIIMAIRSPIVGGGFDSTFTNRATINSLITDWDIVSFIPSSQLEFGDVVFVAHSVYFQVLADHGFVGLFLYLGMLMTAYFSLTKIYKQSQVDWHKNLAEKLKLSLIVFMVAGGALSSAYNDLIFTILGCTATLGLLDKKAEKQSNSSTE
jgi:probable O-glycosylation ligase (exosortase A-associated)